MGVHRNENLYFSEKNILNNLINGSTQVKNLYPPKNAKPYIIKTSSI